jgi:hypothetical protein
MLVTSRKQVAYPPHKSNPNVVRGKALDVLKSGHANHEIYGLYLNSHSRDFF